MAPEHKFATAARLCSEVLAGFADGALPLETASEALRDVLHILASKDIKVCAFSCPPHVHKLCPCSRAHIAAAGRLCPFWLASSEPQRIEWEAWNNFKADAWQCHAL